MSPPILLILFNRPETSKIVLSAVREVKPKKLYISCDGPRKNNENDLKKVAEVRSLISLVDWDCEVYTKFLDENFGIKDAVRSAITWFFQNVPSGIILEDDCVPNKDFFTFCETLLNLYKTDDQIMQISGTNFQPKKRTNNKSYFFSKYNHVWGWATWARAWEKYDVEMTGLDDFFISAKKNGFWLNSREEKYWKKIFLQTQNGLIKTWDYQWKFSMWKNNGLCVYPEWNMVKNIGFGENATNTKRIDKNKSDRVLQTLEQFYENEDINQNRDADLFTFNTLYWGTPLERLLNRIHKLCRILRIVK